jgi:uncharacterized protein (DUF952 family)
LAFKICGREEWLDAEARGAFAGSAVDLADGYIHLSTAGQFAETLRRHFASACDLVCLTVDLGMLGAAVRWEHSRGGDLFPHIYAVLPVVAVRAVRPLPDDVAARAAFAP